MANYTFLQKLGVFAIPGFLTPEECGQWRSVANATEGRAAMVYSETNAAVIEEHRRTLDVLVEGPIRAALEEKLRALQPVLEKEFDVQLGEFETVQCLVYRTGDFFRLHADAGGETERGDDSEMARKINARRVTVLVYLNEPNHATEPYGGGVLSLYGLMGGAAGKGFGFPVDVETGLLIAFRPTLMHEVSPVEHGKRYSLVTWFKAAGSGSGE